MEVWHWAETSIHYAATSYFYGRPLTHNVEPVVDTAALAIPEVELHIFKRENAVEGEDLEIVNRIGEFPTAIQTLGDGSDDSWSNMQHLWARPTKIGQSLTLNVPFAEAGSYQVVVYPTKSWDYGVLQFLVDGRRAGEPIDTFNIDHPTSIGRPEAFSLGVHDLEGSSFDLTINVVGTNESTRPPHYYWGLDCVVLKKQ